MAYRHPSMIIVSEEPMVSLGSSLALSTADMLGEISVSFDQQSPPITCLESSSSLNTSPEIRQGILHIVLRGKEDAQNLLQTNLQEITCLGIQVALSTGNQMVAPETAQNVGTLIQEIYYHCETTPIAMTLDLPLYLAMLQANSLPKTEKHNCFQVLCSEEIVSTTYSYDWNNPFGGTDPLACGSSEYRYRVPGSFNKELVASAYTALMGYDLDAVSSAAISASLGTVVASGNSLTPEYNLETVEAIVDHYQTNLQVIEDNGVLRQKYIEFGYK
jgi:hypothetical protein